MKYIAYSLKLLVLLLCLNETVYALDDLSLAPLIDVERNSDEQAVTTHILGPLWSSRTTPTTREFALHPLFYWLSDSPSDSKEFAFLYPFSVYRQEPGKKKFEALLYILTYKTELAESGFKEREFTFFPLVFTKKAERRENSYFAFFPAYGEIKGKFHRDSIKFVLFPLYLRTVRKKEVNTSFLWPIFGFYRGGGQHGFRFWPLFGYRKKKGELDEKFVLWPLYVRKRKVFYGDEINSLSVLPFYSSINSKDRTVSTYLWPFFNHIEDRKRGIKRWDVPWPLFNITRRTKEDGAQRSQTRFFPLYSRFSNREDREGFILWPLYRYKYSVFETYRRRQYKLLLFLYSDIRDEPIAEGGRRGRRIDFWPLFSYARDGEGTRSFYFLSLLDPFLHGNKGIERTYSPLWRLYTWRKTSDGVVEASFLWNMYQRRSSSKGVRVRMRAIIPLFSYVGLEGERGFSVLGGLVGYSNKHSERKLRLLYIPITLSSAEEAMSSSGEDQL